MHHGVLCRMGLLLDEAKTEEAKTKAHLKHSFCQWHTQPKALRRELSWNKATGIAIPWTQGPRHTLFLLYRLAKCYLLMQKTELRLKCHKYPECKTKKQLKSCKITTKLLSQDRKSNSSSQYLGPNSVIKKLWF